MGSRRSYTIVVFQGPVRERTLYSSERLSAYLAIFPLVMLFPPTKLLTKLWHKAPEKKDKNPQGLDINKPFNFCHCEPDFLSRQERGLRACPESIEG